MKKGSGWKEERRMSAMDYSDHRVKFDGDRRALLAELIRQHGARGAIAHAPEPVCLKTVLRIAREFEIPLQKGRRPKRAA